MTERGPIVARKRPTASNVPPSELTVLDGGRPHTDGSLLTRAQAHALRRSAPLTHIQLREHLKPLPERRLRPL